MIVASLGGFYVLKSNHEIGKRKIAETMVYNHLDHLSTIYIGLSLANEIYMISQNSEILKTRSFEARRAIEILDDMRKYLEVFEGFPLDDFDKELSNLREEFDKGDPYGATENLANFIKFVSINFDES